MLKENDVFIRKHTFLGEKLKKTQKSTFKKPGKKHDCAERIDSIWKIWEIFKNQNARTGFLHILPKADRQKNPLKK